MINIKDILDSLIETVEKVYIDPTTNNTPTNFVIKESISSSAEEYVLNYNMDSLRQKATDLGFTLELTAQ